MLIDVLQQLMDSKSLWSLLRLSEQQENIRQVMRLAVKSALAVDLMMSARLEKLCTEIRDGLSSGICALDDACLDEALHSVSGREFFAMSRYLTRRSSSLSSLSIDF